MRLKVEHAVEREDGHGKEGWDIVDKTAHDSSMLAVQICGLMQKTQKHL